MRNDFNYLLSVSRKNRKYKYNFLFPQSYSAPKGLTNSLFLSSTCAHRSGCIDLVGWGQRLKHLHQRCLEIIQEISEAACIPSVHSLWNNKNLPRKLGKKLIAETIKKKQTDKQNHPTKFWNEVIYPKVNGFSHLKVPATCSSQFF